MPSKILLISINRCEAPYAVFPLGLAYIDSALRRAGHHTKWIDFQFAHEPIAAALKSFQPDFVGISLRNIDDILIKKREIFFGALPALCQEIRAGSRAPIILGGSGFSIFPEALLEQTGADYGIEGEGEVGLLRLVEALSEAGEDLDIPGLVFRERGRVVVNPRSCALPGEAVGEPERPPVLVEGYLGKSSILNLQTQRGCAFHCGYCTYPLIEGRSYRRRPPEAVAEELEKVQAAGASYVFFVDSVFNSSTAHVLGICEAILRKGLKIRWGCFLRPKHLTAELMATMARAGLTHVEFGSDSFCDSVLETYGKCFTFHDILESTQLARRAQVDCCHFLICGGPGETLETLRISFENSRRLGEAVVLALVGMRVYPRTPLFDRAVQEGVLSPEADLLQPFYYVSPAIREEEVFAQLREFSRLAPSWIVGDPPPTYLKMAERLRQGGLIGPLWSYFAMMQRLGASRLAAAR